MPQFSVIIPIYNAAETLAQALQSVQSQTFADWEIVAVNDGSNDQSAVIFAEICGDDSRAKLLQQPNAGLGNARNVAVQHAKGTWLVFLDADDYWSPNKLEILAKKIATQPEVDFFYHPILELSKSGLMRERNFRPAKNADEFLRFGNPFVPSAVALKKSVFLAAGGFVEDRNQVEDLLLWLRLFKRGTQFKALKSALTIYRVGFGVTSHLEEHLQKVTKSIEVAETDNLISVPQKVAFLNQKNYEAARQLHKQGLFNASRNYYKKVVAGGFKKQILALLCALHIKM